MHCHYIGCCIRKCPLYKHVAPSGSSVMYVFFLCSVISFLSTSSCGDLIVNIHVPTQVLVGDVGNCTIMASHLSTKRLTNVTIVHVR